MISHLCTNINYNRTGRPSCPISVFSYCTTVFCILSMLVLSQLYVCPLPVGFNQLTRISERSLLIPALLGLTKPFVYWGWHWCQAKQKVKVLSYKVYITLSLKLIKFHDFYVKWVDLLTTGQCVSDNISTLTPRL